MLLFCSVPISREHRDKHIWVVKEKGGSSNVYISMHLPLLAVEGLGSKSSGRHTYTGAIQHDRVVHLAAVSKDMPSSVASSVKALPHSEEITLTDQTEFNDLFSLSKNMQLSERMQLFIRSISELWVVVLLFCSVPRKSPSSLKAHILTFQQFEYHCFRKVAPFDEFLLHKVD